ncbi:MAG: RHS repeat-associated core domain-containing protein [Treponema sp.]|nr:RHS repeat-associated core domain-containing protein [Treponema sp.]
MVRSRVVDDEARTIASTRYGYDVLGRRTLVQDNGTTTLRTLYDGLGFDVVKESPVYASGSFVDTYNTGIQYTPAGYATGERYRYLDGGATATTEKYQYIEDNAYQTVSSRYSGERTMLYAHGSPVAINRSSGTRGYLGTDILGSTRSVTDNHGVQESYYDYDIFGSPITGNYTTGSDYGYLGKTYDSITGLYNYGYRDYSPQTVRFTTVDPIRDGSNWFAYVNNDPVNYVDLWGLLASDVKVEKGFSRAILSGVGKIGTGTLKTIAGGLGVAAAGLASTVIVADNVTGVLVVNDAALALTVPAAVAAGVYAGTGVQEIAKGMSEVVKGVSDAITTISKHSHETQTRNKIKNKIQEELGRPLTKEEESKWHSEMKKIKNGKRLKEERNPSLTEEELWEAAEDALNMNI